MNLFYRSSLILIALMVLGTCTKLFAQAADPVAVELDNFLRATEQTAMETQIKNWHSLPLGTSSELMTRLMQQLSLTNEIPLNVNATGSPKDKATGHDLSIAGGRSAWALEKFLNCRLPAITKESAKNQWQQASHLALMALLEKGRKQKEQTKPVIKLKGLTLERKLAMAVDSKTERAMLSALAQDSEPRVRRAAASNPRTPIDDVWQLMTNDPDDEVRAAARENHKHARTVPQELGE